MASEAKLQVVKNAYRSGDGETVRRGLRASLEAAERALTMDPGSDQARRFVVDRRKRISAAESGKE